MWLLLTAVVSASLLGSMHCVGMCGPLAIWASGAGDRAPRRTVVFAGTLYHIGRLATYMLAGLIAGAIGSAIDIGGDAIGFQVAAARVVGSIMIVLGVFKLRAMLFPDPPPVGGVQPSRVGGLLVKLRPYVFRLPIPARGFVTGLLTTLLPCGWLYLFALIAAGTGSMVMGPIVMAAFWLGTVPALVALVAGTQALSRKFTRVVPAAAAILLILTGCYTASGRGFASLDSLASLQGNATVDGEPTSLLDRVRQANDQPLPCCQQETQRETPFSAVKPQASTKQ